MVSGVSMAGCFLKLKMKVKTTVSLKNSEVVMSWWCLCCGVLVCRVFFMQRVQEPCPRNVGTRIEKTHVQCVHF